MLNNSSGLVEFGGNDFSFFFLPNPQFTHQLPPSFLRFFEHLVHSLVNTFSDFLED